MKRLPVPGIQKHLLFLGILVVYVLSANTLFARFFVTQGKPAATGIDLPEPGYAAIVKVGYLRATRVEGEDVFELQGFAFLRADTNTRNRIRVVFQNEDGTNLVFATEPPTAPAMVDSSDYKNMGVEHSEFRVLISKYAVPPGRYEIGILLDHPESDPTGSQQVYTLTGAKVRRTPNYMRYTRPPDEE